MRGFSCFSRLGVALAAVALLAGCSAGGSDDPSANLLIDPLPACVTYQGTLEAVNDVIGDDALWGDEIEARLAIIDRVEEINAVVIPLCDADTPPASNSAAARRVLAGVADLLELKEGLP